jgi:predicted ATPase
MLESLSLKAFKAYGEATTVPLEPFTVLVGPNGAGKSTILQAIDLLGAVVRSTLPEHLKAQDWDYADLLHLRSAKAELGIVARLRLGGELLEWSITFGKRRSPGIAKEQVVLEQNGERAVLLERNGRTMWRLVEAEGDEREQIAQTLTSSWLATLETDRGEDARRFPRLCRLASWARRIRGHFFLDPLKLRAPGRGEHKSIGPNGENLAAFLAGLRKKKDSRFPRLVDRVRKHYPPLQGLAPRRGQYGWTHLEVEERWNGERVTLNARQVSDGLLRLIAVATMHESEPRTSVLLLDEIENGMHPQLLGHFTEMLQDLAPDTQVIVTTHSPVALNFVRSDTGIVIVDRGRGGVPRCTRLTGAKGYEKLRAHFDPGELWYNLGEEKLVQ